MTVCRIILLEQRFLIREVEIDRALGDTGAFGNVLEPRIRETMVAKYFHRGVQDLLWPLPWKAAPLGLVFVCPDHNN